MKAIQLAHHHPLPSPQLLLLHLPLLVKPPLLLLLSPLNCHQLFPPPPVRTRAELSIRMKSLGVPNNNSKPPVILEPSHTLISTAQHQPAVIPRGLQDLATALSVLVSINFLSSLSLHLSLIFSPLLLESLIDRMSLHFPLHTDVAHVALSVVLDMEYSQYLKEQEQVEKELLTALDDFGLEVVEIHAESYDLKQ